MTLHTILIIYGVISNALLIFAVYFGFRMGRLTKDSPDNIGIVPNKMGDTTALDTPDIFSEMVNDGESDDPDGRVRTL